MSDKLEMHTDRLLSWGMRFSDAIVKSADIRRQFLETSITALVAEFNMYAAAVGDVPWWYNERALLGFFVSGLVRSTQSIVLQEYSCSKGTGKHKGRADLWVQYLDASSTSHSFLFESKYSECSAFCRYEKDWDLHWEDKALIQASDYARQEAAPPDFIGSLCFLPVYSKLTKQEELDGAFSVWSDMQGFPNDRSYFYCIVRLAHTHKVLHEDGEYAYRFIRITGLLQPP